ncbi:MAG: hypothetical protein JW841_11915 [Deltaproteobacteria bacterium]|nr:hypothetical protein [Deltaproteobacteria bacterium]
MRNSYDPSDGSPEHFYSSTRVLLKSSEDLGLPQVQAVDVLYNNHN